MTIEWLLVPISFLLGTFPSALMIGRLVGHDPITEGSGNPGATNMFRIAGKRAGIPTLIIDVFKALIACGLGHLFGDTTTAVWCGAAAVLGHMFPFIRASRGGKGVACFGGLAIGAWPILAPVGLLAWIGAAKLFNASFMGAMVGVPAVVVGTLVIGRPWIEVTITAAIGVVIIARHHKNISQFLAQRSAPDPA